MRTENPSALSPANLSEKFALFDDHWRPRIAAVFNGMHLKLAKLRGEFVWHKHDDADELFWVHKGRLLIKLRDRDIRLNEGEFVVIPRGVEHKPVAEDEVHVVLIEPAGTLNTGNVSDERTVEDPQWI